MNPKLEFYRFKLNPKNEEFKTFGDFAKEEMRVSKKASNEKIMKAIFAHFIKSLDGEYSKNDRLKKEIALIRKATVNKYLDLQPKYNSESDIISGVINGGPYGRDRILTDKDNKDESSVLTPNKTVLLYFYFLLYTPIDHDEGCFIIHSNGSDESITRLFRNFISNIFKGNKYRKVQCESFCPKSFQDEFKKEAKILSLTFKKSFVENTPNTEGISNIMQEYDIKIEATPKNKNILMQQAREVKDFFDKKLFGTRNNQKQLEEFDQTKIQVENQVTSSTKIFEWNTQDNDFVPVVYLNGRVTTFNGDGTPQFSELSDLCLTYFNDEVLPELRPDLNVTRS